MQHNSTFPIKQNELDMLRDEASGYLKVYNGNKVIEQK